MALLFVLLLSRQVLVLSGSTRLLGSPVYMKVYACYVKTHAYVADGTAFPDDYEGRVCRPNTTLPSP